MNLICIEVSFSANQIMETTLKWGFIYTLNVNFKYFKR